MEPQLDFWRYMVLKMVENKVDEETESGGVDRRHLISRRGTLVYHELMTAPKYCVK